MKDQFWCAVGIAVLVVVAAGTVSLAQAPAPQHFSGLLNDYTLGAGPYEMRGSWSVTLHPTSATGDFSAAMNMVHSDYYVVNNPSAATDDTSTGRNPHTHHITMKGAALTEDVNGCEIQLVGPASVTLNGGAPPFDPTLTNPSQATVCITGGVAAQFANVTLTFQSGTPAAGHFGSQPIHGVIRDFRPPADRDRHDGNHQQGRR